MEQLKKTALTRETESGRNGLFLLHEGLPPTIFESQVLNHLRQMNQCGLNLEVWSFALSPRIYRQSNKLLQKFVADYGVKIRLFRGVWPAVPFSRFINALILLFYLKLYRNRPDFIHARTEYSAAVAALLKSLCRFRLVWDARGDTLSEFRKRVSAFSLLHRMLSQAQVLAIKKRLHVSAKSCDQAIFVSNELQKLQGKNIEQEKCLIVPCLADEELFYYDEELRNKVRKRLGYNDDNVVMVYCGSTAPWQCVPETVDIMTRMMELNEKYRGLIISSYPEAFKDYVPEKFESHFVVTSTSLKDVNDYLNAADLSFLIREPSPINWVASPVKFAEYSMAGLVVVAEGTVEQVVNIGRRIGNVIDVRCFLGLSTQDLSVYKTDRYRRAERAREIYSRKKFTEKFRMFYEAMD
jgi:hypothetical protein